jgi:hypothetical protein
MPSGKGASKSSGIVNSPAHKLNGRDQSTFTINQAAIIFVYRTLLERVIN